jgi:molybdate/tungstate transport system substrate-binding protein
LGDHINLGNYQYDKFYAQAKVKVTGKKPGTWITRTGKSCTYGVTITNEAPNPKGAKLFLAYMLSPEGGLKVLKSMGQPPFIPCRVNSMEIKNSLPEKIASLVEVKP